MKTCYNCGKILFTSKVLGQIGDNMYTFCSDKCRTATWHKIGVKDRNSLDSTESEIDIFKRYCEPSNGAIPIENYNSKTI